MHKIWSITDRRLKFSEDVKYTENFFATKYERDRLFRFRVIRREKTGKIENRIFSILCTGNFENFEI